MSHRRNAYLLVASALAAFAIFLVYWNGLSGPFLLDDDYNIPQTQISELSWPELNKVLLDNRSGILRRPISVLTFALNHLFLGSEPFGFKLINVLLHVLCAALLFVLGARLVQDCEESGDAIDRRRAWLVAGILAGIWALHPLQVGTVLYTVQRMAMLAGLFSVAALICYTIARRRLVEGDGGILVPAGLFGLFALLALFSKESGALIVFYVPAVEIAVYRFRAANTRCRRTVVLLLTIYSLLPIGIGIAYFLTHIDPLLQNYAVRDFSLGERLLTQAGVLWYYAKLILVPDITAMSVYHDDFPVADLDVKTVLQVLSIPAVLVAAVLVRRVAPILALGVLWFLASHVIESSVFPLELVFEHRNYLAVWGLLLPVVYYLVPNRTHTFQRTRFGCIVVLGMVFAFQTFTRVQTWSDFHLLAAVTASEHPNSARARHTFSQSLTAQRKFEAALDEARTAEALDPRYPGYTLTVLMAECVVNRVSADTIDRARKNLSASNLNAHTSAVLNTFIEVAVKRECDGLNRDSLLYVMEGVAEYARREQSDARRSAGLTYLGIAQSLFPDKRDLAIETLRESFAADQENISAIVAIGHVQILLGEIEAAKETLALARQQNARNLVDNSRLFPNLEQKIGHLENRQ